MIIIDGYATKIDVLRVEVIICMSGFYRSVNVTSFNFVCMFARLTKMRSNLCLLTRIGSKQYAMLLAGVGFTVTLLIVSCGPTFAGPGLETT